MSVIQDDRTFTVIATVGHGAEKKVQLQYTNNRAIGHGSFGVVYQAKLVSNGELVAIKKVLQDKRYKNRELDIMRSLEHENIVNLRYFFYSTGNKRDELYLNLMLEFLPETLYKAIRRYTKSKLNMPMISVKAYVYQLFRGVAFVHAEGFCHRDIKPQNLLVDPSTGVLKICDFGSAKQLVPNEINISYICSRYYRAPELIFGAAEYTNSIDTWSCGCVFAECLLGHPLFTGDCGVDQLVAIIRILGTPSAEDIKLMNPSYSQLKMPYVKPHPWISVFRERFPQQAVDLVSQILVFRPSARPGPLAVCAHEFFNELRQQNCKLPNGKDLPSLFNFNKKELKINSSLNSVLIPAYLKNTNTEGPNPSL